MADTYDYEAGGYYDDWWHTVDNRITLNGEIIQDDEADYLYERDIR